MKIAEFNEASISSAIAILRWYVSPEITSELAIRGTVNPGKLTVSSLLSVKKTE